MTDLSQYEEIISDFKRKAGKLVSDTYPHYGYDVYHPHTADQLTGLLEQAIRKIEFKILQGK